MNVPEMTIKLYCCSFQDCNKEYQNKYNLMRHINVNHLKKKRGACEICGKIFIDTYNLKEHYTIHSNTKPFSCEVCQMTFRNNFMLKRHKRQHLAQNELDD